MVARAATLTCERCGEPNPDRARFCLACGVQLEAPAEAHEERRLVSVLFIDLVGFTALSDGTDPEDVRDLLERYHRYARGRIEQYGGTVDKFIGDAVMAVFGAPVAFGDDAERAVRAGLDVLAGLEPGGSSNLRLAARAAVNTGDAIVRLGDPATGEAIAMGDVVNTAARLQTAAPTGGLLVGEETHRATRFAIRYEPHPAIDAKGKAEPVAAWLAQEPVTAPAERPVSGVVFVGRDRELEVFRSVWSQAVAEARPHVVTVLGAPGIGKSRLCAEVSATVAADGGRVLRGRCLPYAEQSGYHAFAQLVRGLAGIFDSDRADVARGKLALAVAELVPEEQAAEITRDISLLTGIGAQAAAIEQRVLFFSARRLVEELGRRRPTLLVFEDIHWAGESELDLLEYLAAHVQDACVVTIALSRPELLDTRPWGAGLGHRTTLSLEPFDDALSTRLADELLAGDLAGELRERLVAVAEGNPLFLEELAAAFAEHRGDELPVTVRAAIASRVDALPPDTRRLLLEAAVVGRTFWRDVLQATSQVERVDEQLDELERRGFVRRESASRLEGDIEYRFRHALIRDVAYTTLPRASRRARHAAVAEFVEARAGEDDTVAWVLAHHWRHTVEPARAVPFLLTAATVAERAWATAEALELYAQAVELADPADVPSIRLLRGMMLTRIGRYEEAVDELAEIAPQLSGSEALDCTLYRARATLWQELDAVDLAQQAVGLAAELGDAAGRAAADAIMSGALGQRGDDLDLALELGERAIESWPGGARPYEYADHLHLQADLTYWRGDYARSLDLAMLAVGLGDQLHSVEVAVRGGGIATSALVGLGRHEEALAQLDRRAAVGLELGQPLFAPNYRSIVFREVHDLEEARRQSELAHAAALESAFSMPLRFAESDLLFTTLLEGDLEAAAGGWGTLWERASESTAWTRWLIVGRLATARAEIELARGDFAAAAEWGERAASIAGATRRRKYEARARTTLGEALVALGRPAAGLTQLRRATAIADAIVNPPGRWMARAALARALERTGDEPAAATERDAARKIVEAFSATLAPERAATLRGAQTVRELLGS